MFRPGTLVLPAGSAGAPTEAVTITSTGIEQLFAQFSVDSVARTFPSFQLAETLGVARTGEVVRLMDRSHIYTLILAEGGDRAALCTALGGEPEVVYAEPNGGVQPCVSPDDPRYLSGEQWNLHNTGQNGGLPDADIDAPEAWEITTGSAATIITILDWGVDAAHEEFLGKTSGDPEFAAGGHGLHVAGIAAANSNNSAGIAGVDWNARIHTQRLPTQLEDYDQEIVDAIGVALDAGSQIINNSWVLLDQISRLPRYSSTVEGVFSDAYKLNRVAVAAMYNRGTVTPEWPAAFGQGIVSVGATDRMDLRWTSSSRGPHIDVCAPGVSITSALINGGYGVRSGTSMATPHVSGLAGLMLAVNPNLYNDDIEQIIRLTTDDLGPPGWDSDYGTGRVNARRALERLLGPHVLRGYTGTGGTIVGSSALYPLTFMAVTGLPDGQYTVRRHEVRKVVTFPVDYVAVPEVWGRGVATLKGFSDEGHSGGSPDFGINFGRGWCEPVPGSVTLTGCTMRTYVYEVFDAQQALIGWFPSPAGNVVYGYAVLGSEYLVGGGCPFVDTRTTDGWREENSVLGRSLGGTLALDAYRLRFAPEVRDGRAHVRLRENEQEYTTLDEMRLVAVDHAPEVRAYAVGEQMMLGTRVPAYRATTRTGRDVTSLVNGLGGYYQGQPGDTLQVEMTAPVRSGVYGAEGTQEDPGGPGSLEGDPKEMEIAHEGALQEQDVVGLGATDAEILGATGIRIEAPDGAGGWRALTHYYPRRYRDETAVDSLGSGSFRLIFVGRHRLHFVGRVVPASNPAALRNLNLLAARHSCLGDVVPAVGARGGTTTVLTPGDTLTLEFAATPPVPNLVREWFLLSRGVYSSTPFASQPPQSESEVESLPARFALMRSRPNPFAGVTTIQFALPVSAPVRLEVFDVQGRAVRVLADGEYPAGVRVIEWDGRDASGSRVRPGVYLYRLISGAFLAQESTVVLPQE